MILVEYLTGLFFSGLSFQLNFSLLQFIPLSIFFFFNDFLNKLYNFFIIYSTFWDSLLSIFAGPYRMLFSSQPRPWLLFLCFCSHWSSSLVASLLFFRKQSAAYKRVENLLSILCRIVIIITYSFSSFSHQF